MKQVNLVLRSSGEYRRRYSSVFPGQRGKRMSGAVTFGIIEHPDHGLCLFDTGCHREVIRQTTSWPMRLLRRRLPARACKQMDAVGHLRQMGYEPEDVRYVFLSHFHADHIGALREFRHARFVYHRVAYESVKQTTGWLALSKGYAPGLLPHDFEQRSEAFGEEDMREICEGVMPRGVDVFDDGSIVMVPLPGVSNGHMGALIRAQRTVLMAGDASWSTASYQQQQLPHPLTYPGLGSLHDYQRSLKALIDVANRRPDVLIVPAHCQDALTNAQIILEKCVHLPIPTKHSNRAVAQVS